MQLRRKTALVDTGLLMVVALAALMLTTGSAKWAPDLSGQYDPLLALLSGSGIFVALLTAMYILVVRWFGGLSVRYTWLAGALAAVGLLEGMGMVPGPGVVANGLAAAGLGLGGVFLAGTLLPAGGGVALERCSLPLAVVGAVALGAVVFVASRAVVPGAALALQVVGSAGFLGWALAIIWKPWPEFALHRRELALFGVLFPLSLVLLDGTAAWSAGWWSGQIIRLVAFGMLLFFVFRQIALTQRSAAQTRQAAPGGAPDATAIVPEQEARLRAELEKANAELDHFAYIASHDLKAPLRAIESLAKWIEDDAGDVLPLDSKRHLKTLLERIGRMRGLLADLLAYSRAGREKGGYGVVPSAQIVREVVKSVGVPAGVVVEIATDLPELQTYAVPLETVFLNLISNAVKHMNRNHGRICVSASLDGDFAAFVVEDDGPGVPADCRQRIFEVFQTLRPRDEVEGSGMGLAIVRKIVESEGGHVTVEDSALGGAKFVFVWPVRSRCERETDAPGSLHSTGGR